VFTPSDFLDLGSPHTVGMALNRMLRAGGIRRLARGLYDRPKLHPKLGPLAPTPDAIAQAIARRDGIRVQPAGAAAANLLRLSEQVPARVVYETDGRSRTVKVGRQTIEFRNTTRRNPETIGKTSGIVIAALRNIGKANVTERRVAHLRDLMSAEDRERLLQDLPRAPAWMHPYLRFVAAAKRRQ
jgi:hypothetical protein